MKVIISIFIVIAILSLRFNFSALEIDKNATRQEYFGDGLGRIYKNRIGVTFFSKIYPRLIKFESNFFSYFNDEYIYVPLFASLVYLGYKQSLPLRGKKND